jgi:hypothetical protein
MRIVRPQLYAPDIPGERENPNFAFRARDNGSFPVGLHLEGLGHLGWKTFSQP